MTSAKEQRRETLLIEILQSGLDLRSLAAEAGSPILAYLAELLARRAREELDARAASINMQVDDLVG